MSAASKKTLSLRFNVLIERQSDGEYLAHCLELDLVAEGSSVDEACREITNLVDVQVRTCIENDNMENLFFPAPKEAWEKLGAIQARMSQCIHETTKHSVPGGHHEFRDVEVDQYCYA